MQIPRRTFLAGLSSAAAAVPFTVLAQDRLPLVGYLGEAGSGPGGFLEEMEYCNYFRDRDFTLAARFGSPADLATLAAELAARESSVLVADGELRLRAAAAATKTIPIVGRAPDLVFLDLVGEDFGRPGGNVTGVVSRIEDLPGKAVALLVDAFPTTGRIAYVQQRRPDIAAPGEIIVAGREIVAATAATLGIEVLYSEYTLSDEFPAVLEALTGARVDAVVAGASVCLAAPQLIAWAAEVRVPVVYGCIPTVEQGGLMTYAIDGNENRHAVADYVIRILEGEALAGLPVLMPSPRLVINLKTAREQGIEFSANILARADVVIE